MAEGEKRAETAANRTGGPSPAHQLLERRDAADVLQSIILERPYPVDEQAFEPRVLREGRERTRGRGSPKTRRLNQHWAVYMGMTRANADICVRTRLPDGTCNIHSRHARGKQKHER